jgi:hypothetical protein
VIPLNIGANTDTVGSVRAIAAAFTILCVIRTRFVRTRWVVNAIVIPTAWQVPGAKPQMQVRVMNASATKCIQNAAIQNVTLN